MHSVESAANYLRTSGAISVCVHTVRSLIVSGQVAAIRLGRRYYITETALNSWLSSHERKAK